ncbi:MAG: hypothetical protein ABII00_06430 [Elusimicrobiota bacterium]
MRGRRSPGGRRWGQIAMPALWLIPSMLLFVYLVYDLAKLSSEKIRQQFALDAAATLEMEAYTDLFNRLAYLNGIFPQRIFRGGMGSGGGNASQYPSASRPLSYADKIWPIRFGGRPGANTPNPPSNFGILHMNPSGAAAVSLASAERVAFGYVTIYRHIGDVAAAQKVVFENAILKNHSLLRKSLFMNLRKPDDESACAQSAEDCGDEPVSSFKKVRIRMHYLSGFKHCKVTISIGGKSYAGVLDSSFAFGGSGLWQLATVPPEDLELVEKGWVVKHHFVPPENYYGIDFLEESDPYVRAHVATRGKNDHGEKIASVWPDTTPRYYTRMKP